jgi:ABC-type amino acid transport substrate-binding protein
MLRTFRGGLLIGLVVAAAVAGAAITYERYDTKTLKRTVKRGEVLCGVNAGLPGFSIPDDKGNWTGFDVDFCRAVASAIFDVRSARRQRALQGIAEPQGRHPLAQYHLEHVARNHL